jgi:hypothetical protein
MTLPGSEILEFYSSPTPSGGVFGFSTSKKEQLITVLNN